jgi:hypothetical protein
VNGRRLFVGLTAAALIAGGCGGSGDHLSAPIYSAAVAKTEAERLLADIPLPSRTERVASPPSSAAKLLQRSANTERYAREQIQTTYWLTSERPERMLAFITAHAPDGATEYSSGNLGTSARTESWSEWLRVPTTSALAGPRQIYVQIALAPGKRYAVRLDAVVAWHLRRPADSLVPASARWLEATVTRRSSFLKAAKLRTLRTVVATNPSVVQAVAKAVNALPLAEPAGPVPACPAIGQPAPVVHLTFSSPPFSAVLAGVVIGTYWCVRGGEATASITTPRAHKVLLSDTLAPRGKSLADLLEAALGHRLHLR